MNIPKLRTLADYTNPELILSQLVTRTTASVMQELAEVLHRHDHNVPYPCLLSSGLTALNWELLNSRMLDLGATFPQARVAPLSQPRFALGRANEPLRWLTPPFRPITLVFLTLEPVNGNAEFGQLVGTLRKMGRDQARLDDLHRAATAIEMLAVLAQIPLLAVSEVQRLTPITVAPQPRPAPATTNYRRWRH